MNHAHRQSISARPVALFIAMALALSTAVPASVRAADPDLCTLADFALCIGTQTSQPVEAEPFPVHTPTVVPAGEAGDIGTLQVTGEKIDDFTCRYRGTGYAVGEGDGDWISAADDQQGAYVAANANAPFFFPSTARSFSVANVGVSIFLGPDWPQPSSVTVSFPWHTSGRLETDTEISPLPLVGGFSDATASYSLSVVLAQGAVEASQEVVQETLDSVPGLPTSRDVVADYPAGNPTAVQVATPANLRYDGFIRSRVDTEAESVAGASANALADFLQAGHAFTDYQDWRFTLPAGFVIGAC